MSADRGVEARHPDSAQARSLIIGPGWLGSAIAAAARSRGDEVWTVRRGSAPADHSAHEGAAHALHVDITADASTWASRFRDGPGPVDHVVLCVAPVRTRGDSHASLYPSAARGALRVAAMLRARTLIYTSSTGVYGASDGALVNEETPVRTDDERSHALVEAERALLDESRNGDWPSRTIVLRVAGLYGPGRDPAARFRGASVTAESAARWCNFAWRDDVVAAVMRLQTDPGATGEPADAAVFNCADGIPVRAGDITRWLEGSGNAMATSHDSRRETDAEHRGAPSGATRTSERAQPATRSNQCVMVDKLRATGWTPTVPDVFDGLRRLGHVQAAQ